MGCTTFNCILKIQGWWLSSPLLQYFQRWNPSSSKLAYSETLCDDFKVRSMGSIYIKNWALLSDLLTDWFPAAYNFNPFPSCPNSNVMAWILIPTTKRLLEGYDGLDPERKSPIDDWMGPGAESPPSWVCLWNKEQLTWILETIKYIIHLVQIFTHSTFMRGIYECMTLIIAEGLLHSLQFPMDNYF